MAFVAFFVLVLFAAIALSLRPKTHGSPLRVENLDLEALSTRYRPMLRLLDGSDFELLNEAGDPAMVRRIRAQRRAIFRGYLTSLGRDHARLCARVRTLILESKTDREDLASALFRMELTFQRMMFGVHVRLALHTLGIGSVTAAPLMKCLEQVRQHAESLLSVEAVTA